jgi:hypothetical protein
MSSQSNLIVFLIIIYMNVWQKFIFPSYYNYMKKSANVKEINTAGVYSADLCLKGKLKRMILLII